jgi:hypothetical protein
MFNVRSGLSLLIMTYICLCILLWCYKPKIMFNGNKVKPFGVGKHKSIFNYNVTIIFMAIIMFYIFEIYWLKKNNFI